MFSKWTKSQTRVSNFTAFLFLAGILTKEPLLFAISGGGLSLLMISLWWCRNALKGIKVSVDFTKKRLFPGDSSTVKIIITSNKYIFVPAIKLTINTSKEIVIEGLNISEKRATDQFWSKMFSVKTGKTLIYEYPVIVNNRGAFHIYDLFIEIKDPTGLGKIIATKPVKSEIIVYPTFVETLPPKVNLIGIEGDHQVKRLIHDDASFFVGSRGYTLGDPLNRIDWKATARVGKLHTKHFAFTSQKQLILVGNIRYQDKWTLGRDPIVIERVIGIMAGLIKWCSSNGYSYEWMFNIRNPHTRQIYHYKSSPDKKELVANLEKLARLKSYTMINFEDVFAYLRDTAYEGLVFVVVTNFITDKMEQEWNRQITSGNQVWIIDPSDEQIQVYPYLIKKGATILEA